MTSGATIHYTLSGAEPTIYDPVVASGSSLTLKRNLTLKAKAWVGSDVSPTASSSFEITGDIAAGSQHVLALKSNRQVFAWGSQQYGRLANGSTSSTVNITSPGAFSYTSGNPAGDAIAIAAGYNQNVILKYDGSTRSPWCVGYGGVGELGNNDNANSTYPVRVVKSTSKLNGSSTFNDWLGDCTAVAAGQFFSGALGADGLVYTWGSNSGNGRLGSGATTGMRYYAGPVLTAASTNLTNVTAIEFGDSQALALDSNHKVWGWGSNSNGQIGNGSTTGSQSYAGTVLASGTRASSPVDLTDVIDISTGDIHSAVVRSNGSEQGTVWTFGSKANGRLGDGNTSGNTGTPTKVKKDSSTYLTNIVQVSAGSQHTLALDESKQVWAWGYNGRGALGNNTTNDNAYASRVLAPSGSGYLSNIVRISTGGIGVYSYSIAVAEDGTVYAWGANDSGQLANGTSSTSAIVKLPVVIGSIKLLPNSPDVTLANTVTQSASPGAATLTATPTDLDGSGNIQKVEFFSNGALLGTKTAPPWTQSLSGLAAGTYYNYSIVTDNDGNTGYSQPSSFTIVPGDTDSDGLPDAWEMTWFGNLVQNGSGDPDNDRVTNAQEYALNTNPTSAADTDSDGLADDWERFWFNGLTSQSGTTDYDGDGLTDAWEYTNRTNPNTSSAAKDGDADGLPDDWERFYFGDTTPLATGDFDSDGLTNLWEYQHLTNANTLTGNQDSDADGLPDDWEILYFNDLTKTATADSDGDKISNAKELAQGTNPNTLLANRDADADGIPDDWENYYFNGSSQTGATDFDSDGLTNKWEFDNDTNPTTLVTERDVDADGLPDDWERFWFTSITLYNGTQDPDADSLSNAQEFSILSNPMTPALEKDTDTDGLFDDWERYYFGSLAPSAIGDPDGDKVSNLQESTIGTHPNSLADTDVDGLPDDWERYYFGNLAQGAAGDPDADKVTNLQEFNQGTNPNSAADTDTDGQPDDWEKQRFGSLDENSSGDPDGDKVTNLQEFTQNTNPNSYADTDTDGLPDDWEMLYFGNLTQTATGDPDVDKVTNLQEFTQGTNPTTAANTDTDSLPDDWEIYRFGNLTQAAAGDPDADKVTNLQEFAQGSDPNSAADSDTDGLPDDWESHHFGNLAQDGAGDPDADKVTNLQEFAQGSDPNSAADSDIDGLPDDWEKFYFGNLNQTASGDPDGDKVTNLQEFAQGTDPNSAVDTDSDGLPDDWEKHYFGNLDQTADDDHELDGLTNLQELAAGTNPDSSDTDFDTISDAGEIEQGKSPTDPNDTPSMEWFTFVGDKPMGELKTGTRLYSVKKGQTRLFVVGSQSDEYPIYTGDSSEFNDTLEWKISPFSIPGSGTDSTGTINVNDRHEDWIADGALGVALNGLPVHIEAVKVIQAPADSDVVVTVTLKATNISDGILPSRLIVGILPADLDVAKIDHNLASGELDESKEETTGAFIPLNSDDDDYSATSSSLGSDKDQSGAINGENDLLPVYLRLLPQLTGTKFLMDIPAHLRVWRSPSREDEILTTTELDASLDTVVYVEGISNATDMLKLNLRFGGQDFANIARIKVSAFEMKGVLNVPGYSVYSYSADGSVPSSAKWITPSAGTLAAGSTANVAKILWDEGPVVGKAIYELNNDYTWDLDVNVVQVKLAAGPSNRIVYGSNLGQNAAQIKSATTGKAMEASLTIEKIIGPSVPNSTSTRGEQFIEVGFIQNVQMTREHGVYEGFSPQKHIRSSLVDGIVHLDHFLSSAAPWLDTAAESGGRGYFQVPAGGASNKAFNVSDTPQVTGTDPNKMSLTIGGITDSVDKFAIEFDLNLYFAVRTVQDVNGSKDAYIQRGKAAWKFDGSGDINTNGVWTQTGNGNTGSASLAEIVDGSLVPVTTGDRFNLLVQSRTWIVE